MFLFLTFIIILCFAFWVRVRWNRVKNYWAARNVPYLPPHFVFGNLNYMIKDDVATWMRKSYEEFCSPYVGAWMFWRPVLIVNSTELTKRILIKDANIFRNRFGACGKHDPIGRFNIFTAKDPLWSNIRRRLNPAFTASKLRAMQHIYLEKSKYLVQRINKLREEQRPVKITDLFADFTTDVLAEASFGVSCNATLTGHSSIRELIGNSTKHDLFTALSWISIFFFPELVDVFRFHLFPKQLTEPLRKIFRMMIEQRGGYNNETRNNRDLLDSLVRLKAEAAKEGEEIDENILLAQATVFLLGGLDTINSALTHAAYEIAFNPDLQDQLFKEIKEAKDEFNDDESDTGVISRLKLLDAVIKETLRKYSTVSWLEREASTDYHIDEKLAIPKGAVVFINIRGMSFDPELFPQPETFDPSRFLPENEDQITPYTFMPFGEGPRHCIGETTFEARVR